MNTRGEKGPFLFVIFDFLDPPSAPFSDVVAAEASRLIRQEGRHAAGLLFPSNARLPV
jgi:hypothetical protein